MDTGSVSIDVRTAFDRAVAGADRLTKLDLDEFHNVDNLPLLTEVREDARAARDALDHAAHEIGSEGAGLQKMADDLNLVTRYHDIAVSGMVRGDRVAFGHAVTEEHQILNGVKNALGGTSIVKQEASRISGKALAIGGVAAVGAGLLGAYVLSRD